MPITRERAYELVEEIPLAALIVCDAGGYYWARFRRDGIAYNRYVGTPVRVEELEQARALVRAEIEVEEATLTPETRRMIERHRLLMGEAPLSAPQLKRVDPRRGANALGSLLVAPPRERQASR